MLQKPLADAPLFKSLSGWWPALARIYKGDFSDLVYGELPDGEEIKKTFAYLWKQFQRFK